MSKALGIGAGFLFFALIAIGLFDLFRGLNATVACVALIIIAVGIFNTWGAAKNEERRRESSNQNSRDFT